jgi:hypothetical protein
VGMKYGTAEVTSTRSRAFMGGVAGLAARA